MANFAVMKITLLCIGKNEFDYVSDGMKIYEERLKHYIRFSIVCIPSLKNASALSEEVIKEKEGELLLKQIEKCGGRGVCRAVLLDERGTLYDSVSWARLLEKKISGLSGLKEIVFVIGGAYGFSKKVYERADEKISLSKMTFSHQLVRVIFLEQLYRAFTIMRGEPYHHK